MPKLQSLLLIGAAHPALAGHFPGAPVVPGVVVLDQVLQLLATWPGFDARRLDLPQVKFLEPLLPGAVASIDIDIDTDRARFQVSRSGATIANGSVCWRPLA